MNNQINKIKALNEDKIPHSTIKEYIFFSKYIRNIYKNWSHAKPKGSSTYFKELLRPYRFPIICLETEKHIFK